MNNSSAPPERVRARAAAAILTIVVGGLLLSCGRAPPRARPFDALAPTVEAVQARSGGLPLVERLSGTVMAENQVALFPEVQGRIVAVHVENGEAVERGQPLVELSDDTLREQVRQAEAGRRINEARLRQAEGRLAELEAEVRRTRELGQRGLVTELELETAAAQLASARADVDLARAQLEQSAATLAQQRDLLSKTVVRAPITGVVGQRNAEIGMQATASTRLFTIGNLDRMKIRVDVTDNMLRYLAVDQPVQILTHGPGNPQNTLSARITRISPFLNEITRSTEAEIEVDNPAQTLRPGMFVPVDVFYGESERATLLPTSALFTDSNTGRTGVFVVTGPMPDMVDTTGDLSSENPPGVEDGGAKPGTPLTLTEPRPVEFRSVRVVARGAMAVAVDTLRPGDWAVTLGQDLLSTEGQQARIRAVSWDHVLELQSLTREDLLQDVLRSTGAGASGNGGH